MFTHLLPFGHPTFPPLLSCFVCSPGKIVFFLMQVRVHSFLLTKLHNKTHDIEDHWLVFTLMLWDIRQPLYYVLCIIIYVCSP